MPKEKLLDHDADGIRELDNPLPRWWLYSFYISIIFAFYYLVAFCFTPLSSSDKVEIAVEKLRNPIEEVQLVQTTLSKKTSPVSSNKPPKSGKEIFKMKCVSCHGAKGEGLIGPNFTDKYWIHGNGELEDIKKVITTGVPAKGMIAWGPLLTEKEIHSVATFIQTLSGTNPPNQKALEGTLRD